MAIPDRQEAHMKRSIQLSGGRKANVIVVSIPDYGYTPFGKPKQAVITAAIDEFNAINKAITLSFNISYTDITPLTREAKNDDSLIADDGLHPSGKEYARWAVLLAPEIRKMLQ